jgi:hypothetical protein
MRTAQCFFQKIEIHEYGSEYKMWGKILKIKKRGQLAIVRRGSYLLVSEPYERYY